MLAPGRTLPLAVFAASATLLLSPTGLGDHPTLGLDPPSLLIGPAGGVEIVGFDVRTCPGQQHAHVWRSGIAETVIVEVVTATRACAAAHEPSAPYPLLVLNETEGVVLVGTAIQGYVDNVVPLVGVWRVSVAVFLTKIPYS